MPLMQLDAVGAMDGAKTKLRGGCFSTSVWGGDRKKHGSILVGYRLFFSGDEILASYLGIIISHCKDNY